MDFENFHVYGRAVFADQSGTAFAFILFRCIDLENSYVAVFCAWSDGISYVRISGAGIKKT